MKIPRVGKALLVAILCGMPWITSAQTQRVTVDVTEADAQTGFTQIKEQTGLNFVYNADHTVDGLLHLVDHILEYPVCHNSLS